MSRFSGAIRRRRNIETPGQLQKFRINSHQLRYPFRRREDAIERRHDASKVVTFGHVEIGLIRSGNAPALQQAHPINSRTPTNRPGDARSRQVNSLQPSAASQRPPCRIESSYRSAAARTASLPPSRLGAAEQQRRQHPQVSVTLNYMSVSVVVDLTSNSMLQPRISHFHVIVVASILIC